MVAMNVNIETGSASSRSYNILDEATELLAGMYGRELESISVKRLIIGVFCTGVKLSNGHGGIAYTPPESVFRAGTRILKDPKPLIRGMGAGELIAGGTGGPFSDVVRLATLNALSVPFLMDRGDAAGAVDDITDYPQCFVDKKICMAGPIIPTLKRLQERGIRNVTIIGSKEAAKEESNFGNYVAPEKAPEALAACDTAVFPGASIADGTIEHLIRCTSRNATLIVVGPTAGFIPDPLFRRRVAIIGTVTVTDSDLALDLLSEGATAQQLFKRCLRKIMVIHPEKASELS
jgi:uncharacterized protein (DUF4213/DUF364 family)